MDMFTHSAPRLLLAGLYAAALTWAAANTCVCGGPKNPTVTRCSKCWVRATLTGQP